MDRTVEIDLAWDGGPARAEEVAQVVLSPRSDGLSVRVAAPSHGDEVPPLPPGPTWGLWEHEVVELFLLGDSERYTELEVGPHGHYLALQLHGRRNVIARELPLECSWDRSPGRWRASLWVPWELVPSGSLRGNAYAIHGSGDRRRFLAHSPVPGAAPDFHRLEHFVPWDLTPWPR